MREEVILPLPSPRSLVPRVTQVKSAWIGASVRAVRQRDLFDRYLQLLPPQFHEVVKNTAPSEWLPVEIAIAHYNACDGLEILPPELVQLGYEAVRHGHGGPLQVTAKLASTAGATPWTLFNQLQRFWDRSWVGGAIGVSKLGPKEAKLEVVGFPLAQFRYVRLGMRGIIVGAAELFCQKVYVAELADLCTPLTLGYRVSWV